MTGHYAKHRYVQLSIIILGLLPLFSRVVKGISDYPPWALFIPGFYGYAFFLRVLPALRRNMFLVGLLLLMLVTIAVNEIFLANLNALGHLAIIIPGSIGYFLVIYDYAMNAPPKQNAHDLKTAKAKEAKRYVLKHGVVFVVVIALLLLYLLNAYEFYYEKKRVFFDGFITLHTFELEIFFSFAVFCYCQKFINACTLSEFPQMCVNGMVMAGALVGAFVFLNKLYIFLLLGMLSMALFQYLRGRKGEKYTPASIVAFIVLLAFGATLLIGSQRKKIMTPEAPLHMLTIDFLNDRHFYSGEIANLVFRFSNGGTGSINRQIQAEMYFIDTIGSKIHRSEPTRFNLKGLDRDHPKTVRVVTGIPFWLHRTPKLVVKVFFVPYSGAPPLIIQNKFVPIKIKNGLGDIAFPLSKINFAHLPDTKYERLKTFEETETTRRYLAMPFDELLSNLSHGVGIMKAFDSYSVNANNYVSLISYLGVVAGGIFFIFGLLFLWKFFALDMSSLNYAGKTYEILFWFYALLGFEYNFPFSFSGLVPLILILTIVAKNNKAAVEPETVKKEVTSKFLVRSR